jgi:hypothetical protein
MGKVAREERRLAAKSPPEKRFRSASVRSAIANATMARYAASFVHFLACSTASALADLASFVLASVSSRVRFAMANLTFVPARASWALHLFRRTHHCTIFHLSCLNPAHGSQ